MSKRSSIIIVCGVEKVGAFALNPGGNILFKGIHDEGFFDVPISEVNNKLNLLTKQQRINLLNKQAELRRNRLR